MKIQQTLFHNPALPVTAVALVLLQACAQSPVLAPAPGANVVEVDGTYATAQTEGVTVTAEASGWPGRIDIENVVTPMKVTVVNDSDRALRVRYSDFGLVSASGKRYAALPPYGVKGSVRESFALDAREAIGAGAFDARLFHVAPHYARIYPALSPYHLHPLALDPYYYRHYYPYWRSLRADVEMPTREMLRYVLPEGVLESGGKLEGYLYFQKVDREQVDTPVTFHAELVDAESGAQFAAARIPFVANLVDGRG